MHFTITAFWDSEASVWVASNDELGLATEAESLDTLEAKIHAMVPELIKLNGITADRETAPFDLLVHDKQQRIACGQ